MALSVDFKQRISFGGSSVAYGILILSQGCCLKTLWTTMHRSKLYVMLSERLQTTFHKKSSCAMFSEYSWVNIEQVKTLSNVVREAPNDITYEKILFNVVLILLGQHCTGQNPMQCCPRGSRQHCIRKNLAQFCLNTLRTKLHRRKPYAMLSQRLQSTLYKKKPCEIFCLNTLGTTLHRSKPYAMLSKMLRTKLHKKKSYSMSS